MRRLRSREEMKVTSKVLLSSQCLSKFLNFDLVYPGRRGKRIRGTPLQNLLVSWWEFWSYNCNHVRCLVPTKILPKIYEIFNTVCSHSVKRKDVYFFCKQFFLVVS